MSLVEVEVANPVAQSASVKTPADRTADLADKTIGLDWNFKPGGNIGLHFQGAIGAAVRHLTTQQADDVAAEFAVVGTTGD
jgi:hypothetical protein